MKELGVEIRVDSILKKEINHGTLIEEVKRENKEIVDRIEHKASLIDEVDELSSIKFDRKKSRKVKFWIF